ncbi:uncharacterized protein LOC120113689 [Hibiscus syriacus]|uniref:uncharacterized protein LOC120113689 n=1 Tax=Hibiscus syriacus TaxID=106335 RepID=UPI001924CD11|nr:uncharacterized protein LOC120113689 [Hibiscus syriacus]
MNVLSKLLNLAASKGLIKYHPKCKRIGLTHLSFADDLLIFCKGTVDSVVGVTSVLDVFYGMSGLKLNASKCELFSAGVSLPSLETLKSLTDFKLGSLPIRYLGIPLTTRKITESDCSTLIDSIKARLHQWSCNIPNYGQIFIPFSVIKKIDQLCSRFFWKGIDKPAAGAIVSWQNICKPKSKGGLGLKDLKTWNKACMMLLIKDILAGEGSLWVAWLGQYIFNTNDFWKANDLWNKIRVKNTKVYWHSLLWHTSWETLYDWAIATWKGKSLLTSLMKISSNALIYTILKEMNKIIFQGQASTDDVMFKAIKETVVFHLRGRPINRFDTVNINLCNQWGII